MALVPNSKKREEFIYIKNLVIFYNIYILTNLKKCHIITIKGDILVNFILKLIYNFLINMFYPFC
jgi:hypothetical protein